MYCMLFSGDIVSIIVFYSFMRVRNSVRYISIFTYICIQYMYIFMIFLHDAQQRKLSCREILEDSLLTF
jgi:hypothetical protein